MGGSGVAGNYTMYVNPFMVVNNMKFTKHYYMGSQRVVMYDPKDPVQSNGGNSMVVIPDLPRTPDFMDVNTYIWHRRIWFSRKNV
jgi:hypothetical protein